MTQDWERNSNHLKLFAFTKHHWDFDHTLGGDTLAFPCKSIINMKHDIMGGHDFHLNGSHQCNWETEDTFGGSSGSEAGRHRLETILLASNMANCLSPVDSFSLHTSDMGLPEMQKPSPYTA